MEEKGRISKSELESTGKDHMGIPELKNTISEMKN